VETTVANGAPQQRGIAVLGQVIRNEPKGVCRVKPDIDELGGVTRRPVATLTREVARGKQ